MYTSTVPLCSNSEFFISRYYPILVLTTVLSCLQAGLAMNGIFEVLGKNKKYIEFYSAPCPSGDVAYFRPVTSGINFS